MSIVFFDVEEWERDRVPKRIGNQSVKIVGESLTVDTINEAKEAEIVSVFTWSEVTEEMLDKLPLLKYIVTRSTGYDHIDIVTCHNRSIAVSNVPGYGERTVAEHTFALMLALSRKILHGGDRTKNGNFSREGLRGFDLENKTLGIVGCGQIGRRVAQVAQAFAMKVIVYDVTHNDELAGRIGFKYVDKLENLLSQSDVISLHAPLTEDTRHLINIKTIGQIKPGALLINTARGDLVQTAALLKALDEGIIKGAGLDVIEHERLIGEEAEVLSNGGQSNQALSALLCNHILLSNPQVIITPHNAFNSEEAVEKLLRTTVNNIEMFMKGKKVNVVS